MPQVTWVLGDSRRVTVEVAAHANMMQAAVANDIRAIVGECGGCLSCATCHVYVDPAWIGAVGIAKGSESDMLEVVEAERRPESRLSCQIKVSPALDGLILHVPVA
jgi:ferredoxin, 2Fe-2S